MIIHLILFGATLAGVCYPVAADPAQGTSIEVQPVTWDRRMDPNVYVVTMVPVFRIVFENNTPIVREYIVQCRMSSTELGLSGATSLQARQFTVNVSSSRTVNIYFCYLLVHLARNGTYSQHLTINVINPANGHVFVSNTSSNTFDIMRDERSNCGSPPPGPEFGLVIRPFLNGPSNAATDEIIAIDYQEVLTVTNFNNEWNMVPYFLRLRDQAGHKWTFFLPIWTARHCSSRISFRVIFYVTFDQPRRYQFFGWTAAIWLGGPTNAALIKPFNHQITVNQGSLPLA